MKLTVANVVKIKLRKSNQNVEDELPLFCGNNWGTEILWIFFGN